MNVNAHTTNTRDSWHDKAEKTKSRLQTRLFIGGDYVDALDGGRFATVNPANGDQLAEMSEGTAKDVDRAVAAALQAFKGGTWSRMAPRARMEIM